MFTSQCLGGNDGFLTKIDALGNILWTAQFGTSAEDDISFAITSGNHSEVIVTGSTWGDLSGKNKGFMDGFLAHISGNGEADNISQFGSEGFDLAMNLALDSESNIYIAGTTSGNFACVQMVEGDAFILKMNKEGKFLFENKFAGLGITGGTSGKDISVDSAGNIYHLGLTSADLFGKLKGEHDCYVVKLKLDSFLVK